MADNGRSRKPNSTKGRKAGGRAPRGRGEKTGSAPRTTVISGRKGQEAREKAMSVTKDTARSGYPVDPQIINNAVPKAEGPSRVDLKLPSYGLPKMAVDRGDGEDRYVVVRSSINQYALRHIAMSVAAHGLMHCYDLPAKLNAAWVAQYIYSWMWNKILNLSMTNDIDVMPAPILDIVHSLEEKICKGMAYTAEGVSQGWGAVSMGNDRVIFGDGFTNLPIITNATYNEASGRDHAKAMFMAAKNELNIKDVSSYRKIARDDPSAFSLSMDVTNLFNDPYSVCTYQTGGSTQTWNSEVFTMYPVKAPWLAKLRLLAPGVANQATLGKTYSTRYVATASPGAYVVDRLKRGLEGYDRAKDDVVIKCYSIETVFRVVDGILTQLRANGFSTPALSNGLSANDVKIICVALLRRLFNPWQAIATGLVVSSGEAGFPIVTGSGPNSDWIKFPNFQFLEVAFASIGPYFLKRQKTMVYPVLTQAQAQWIDWTSANYAGTGIVVTNFNYLNYDNGGTIQQFSNFPQVAALFKAWIKAMRLASANVPVSQMLENSKYNACNFTQYLNGASGDVYTRSLYNITYMGHLDAEQLTSCMSLWLPHLSIGYTSTAIDLTGLGFSMKVFGEYGNHSLYGDGALVDSIFIAAAELSVHVTGEEGFSTQQLFEMRQKESTSAGKEPGWATKTLEYLSVVLPTMAGTTLGAGGLAAYQLGRLFGPHRGRQQLLPV